MVEPSVNSPTSESLVGADETGDPTPRQLGLGPVQPLSLADRISDGVARLETFRDRPIALAVALSGLLAAAVALPLLREPTASTSVDELIPQVTLTPTTVPTGEASEVVVHVSGAVGNPGVYILPESARVVDAIEAAGGANPGADVDQLNLAAPVIDGHQIRVPRVGEMLPPPPTQEEASGPVDLNRADATRLQDLPGVGPATAEAIVAFREEHGSFRTVDDLLDVPGIGPAKMAAIADAAVVR